MYLARGAPIVPDPKDSTRSPRRRGRDVIAEALRQRLLSEVHLGMLRPGAKLPSVRDLAQQFDADPRTVLDAYRTLEAEGLVELRPRSGIYFAPTTRGGTENDSQRIAWIVDVALEGLKKGIPLPALGDHFRQTVASARLKAACIECNADQINALCKELSSDFGLQSTGVHVEDTVGVAIPSAVLRADLLVTTPFHAGDVQALAAKCDKSWIAVTARADIFSEISRRLADGPVYFVASDPKFVAKLQKIYSSNPGAGNFHAVLAKGGDLDAIPDDAPTYVTRTARERLAGTKLLARVMPEARTFSSESAREILAFIVNSNLRSRDG